jgi:hypothetical protein
MDPIDKALVQSILAVDSQAPNAVARITPPPGTEAWVRAQYAGAETWLNGSCKISLCASGMSGPSKLHHALRVPDRGFDRGLSFHPGRGISLTYGTDAVHWNAAPLGVLAKHIPLLSELRALAVEHGAIQDAAVLGAAARSRVALEPVAAPPLPSTAPATAAPLPPTAPAPMPFEIIAPVMPAPPAPRIIEAPAVEDVTPEPSVASEEFWGTYGEPVIETSPFPVAEPILSEASDDQVNNQSDRTPQEPAPSASKTKRRKPIAQPI